MANCINQKKFNYTAIVDELPQYPAADTLYTLRSAPFCKFYCRKECGGGYDCMSCEEYGVDTFTSVVTNADGSVTLSVPDGSGATIPAPSTLVDNGDNTITHVAGGVSTIITLGATSVLTANGDGTWSHDDGEGNIVAITTGTALDNGDGTSTISFPDGTSAVVCTDCDHTAIVDNGDGTYTGTNADGTIINWVGNSDTAGALVDNADGTFTWTSADLATTFTFTVGVTSVVTDNANGIYSHDDGSGNVVDINTVTAIVDNGDGTSTITNTAGDAVTVCTDCDHAVVVDNGDGTYTVTNADGTTLLISTASAVDNANGTFTITNPDGTTVVVNTTTIVDNGDGTFTITDVTGDAAVVINPDNDNNLIANVDGSFSWQDSTGTTLFTIPAATAGSISAITQVVTAGVTVASHADGNGTAVDILTPLTTVTQPDDNSSFTYTDESGAEVAVEMCGICPSIKISKLATSKGPYLEGDTVTYRFVVTNDGALDLTNVSVSDVDSIVLGGPISLTAGSVDATTFSATHVITAAEASEGYFINTATVVGTAISGDVNGNDSELVEIEVPLPTIFFFQDGDVSEANVSVDILDAIANNEIVMVTDGSGVEVQRFDPADFASIEAWAITTYGVGTTVDPLTYVITPNDGTTVNVPMCADQTIECFVATAQTVEFPLATGVESPAGIWTWSFASGVVATLDLTVIDPGLVVSVIDSRSLRIANPNPSDVSDTGVGALSGTASWSIDATNYLPQIGTCLDEVSLLETRNSDYDNFSFWTRGANDVNSFAFIGTLPTEAPIGTFTSGDGQVNSVLEQAFYNATGGFSTVRNYTYDYTIMAGDLLSTTIIPRVRKAVQVTSICNGSVILEAVDNAGTTYTAANIRPRNQS